MSTYVICAYNILKYKARYFLSNQITNLLKPIHLILMMKSYT